MGTLWSELGPIADQVSESPRVYVDANLPAGLVNFMRTRLHWDVFFVLEHPHLRRARDIEHFRLARQLSRTLITLDRDYLDEHTFPSAETAGILVVSAPDERGLAIVLTRFDQAVFHKPERATRVEAQSPEQAAGVEECRPERATRVEGLPLNGRKLHAHIDWMADDLD